MKILAVFLASELTVAVITFFSPPMLTFIWKASGPSGTLDGEIDAPFFLSLLGWKVY